MESRTACSPRRKERELQMGREEKAMVRKAMRSFMLWWRIRYGRIRKCDDGCLMLIQSTT